jgi:hypothetical protein
MFNFLKRVKEFPPSYFEEKIKLEKRSYLFDFLKYFIFIVILTNFIFIGTITIHEAGHFVFSKIVPGCSFGKIVYEGNLPHTEILCDNSPNSENMVLLGGILLPILISLLFLFGGGTFMKEIALLIFGFNFVITYQDLLDLGFSKNISIFSSILGGMMILLAIGLLAKSRTTEEEFIHLGGV